MEVRTFQAAQYPTHSAPLVEGSVIWTPTALTTLTGTLSRDIEDPESGGTNGYVLTRARLVVDHEIMLNVFLQGRGGVEYAQYLQSGGGSQTSLNAGAGVTWLISPRIQLSLNYDFTRLTGASNTTSSASTINPFTSGTGTTSAFTQSIAALTLHFAL
jgi:hypothetical protein